MVLKQKTDPGKGAPNRCYHAGHRRHAEIENAIRDLKYGVGLNHMPSGRFAANGAWLAVQVMAHNLARWTARIGLGEQTVTTRPSGAGRLTRSARRLTLHLPKRWPWEEKVTRALPGRKRFHSRPDAARPPLTHQPANPTSPPTRATRGASASCRVLSRHLTRHSHCKPPSAPPKAPADRRQPPVSPKRARVIAPVTPSPPFHCPHAVHRWIRG